MNTLQLFIRESREELKRVNWPTREETIRLTIFVIVFSIAAALFLGLFDFGFSQAVRNAFL